jgi:hypothetical protein
MSNIVIDIAAEFTGNKAFKQAETSTDKLSKGVKKLAGALGLAFSTRAIVNFGKLAVKASLEQQAEQNRLNQLLKVGVGATTQEIALLNDQAKILEKIGVVSGGNITQTQSQLATFNLQVSTIEALTPAILDYVTAEKGATASTADFKSMTNGLAQALNGNFASLTRVGFVLDENTKKQIANGTEAERANALVKVLNSTYKDFNKNLRATDAGQMQVLANSAQEATTIIGTGLLDALKAVGRDNSIEDLANSMESAALASADFIRGLGQIASFEVSGETKSLIGLLTTPFRRSLSAGPLGAITRLGEQARLGAGGGFPSGVPKDLAALSKYSTVLKKVVKDTKVLTAEQKKQLAASKLKLAIEKGNAALLKGEEIFDMDKIQIAAALTGQAEALGKATNAAQVLAITQDVARLNVKKSILALDDAIASKDEAAIIAATKKLNADLAILGTLSGQSIKLSDIKSILDSLKPKDLIDQANLDQALAKIRQMLSLLAGMGGTISTAAIAATAVTPTTAAATAVPPAAVAATAAAVAEAVTAAASDIIPPVDIRFTDVTAAELAAVEEYGDAASERANAIADATDALVAAGTAILAASSSIATVDIGSAATSSIVAGMLGGADFGSAVSGARYAAQAAANYNITVNAGVGDPNAIAEAIENLLREANARGTLTSGLLNIG